MKKLSTLLAVVTVAFSSSVMAEGLKLSVGPDLGVVTKVNEPAGTSVRTANLGWGADLAYFLSDNLGFGIDVSQVFAQTTILGLDFDTNILGLTAGPRYNLFINNNLFIEGSVNVGNYNTNNVFLNENSFGFNVGASIGMQLKSDLALSLKNSLHYVRSTGAKDDALIWTVGPRFIFNF